VTLPTDGVMLEPPALSSLVTDRSTRLSASFAARAAPLAGVTLTVLSSVPVAAGLTVPVTVYVIELPAGSEAAVSLMLPLPSAVKPLAPPVCVAVQVGRSS
jgi:hypothetical protein